MGDTAGGICPTHGRYETASCRPCFSARTGGIYDAPKLALGCASCDQLRARVAELERAEKRAKSDAERWEGVAKGLAASHVEAQRERDEARAEVAAIRELLCVNAEADARDTVRAWRDELVRRGERMQRAEERARKAEAEVNRLANECGKLKENASAAVLEENERVYALLVEARAEVLELLERNRRLAGGSVEVVRLRDAATLRAELAEARESSLKVGYEQQRGEIAGLDERLEALRKRAERAEAEVERLRNAL